ncbi:anillin isoform X3 [Cherax quadricarinatus]|uniref:anillin isoform X3 n=1 Tax=Cherax quadricarinatus TaxID=27406 RepID=UPI00387E684C
MADPFVVRMMARSQARRAGIARTTGDFSNKENVGVSDSTRTRLKQINSLYSEDSELAVNPLRPSILEPSESVNTLTSEPTNDRSSNKVPSAQTMNFDQSESLQPKTSPSRKDEGSTSPCRPRLKSLARRAQEMKNWEDDYTRATSNSHNSKVEVEGNLASSMHGYSHENYASNTRANIISQRSSTRAEGRSAVKTNGSLSPCHAVASVQGENIPPQYYFGDGPSGAHFNGSSCESPAIPNPSTNTSISFSSSSSYNTTPNLKNLTKLKMPRETTVLHQPKSPTSPTKKLVWDKGMLNSLISFNNDLQDGLEAQGFTPSDSRSRLYYDFKKETKPQSNDSGPVKPAPAQEKNELPTSHASLKPSTSNASLPPPPPVVVSYLPKSPCSSPTRGLGVRSPELKPAKDRARDTSPSKVGEMRSRWEQHIRQASPERADRSRSPRKSVVRSVSPKKMTSNQSSNSINELSPKKSGSTTAPQSPTRCSSPVRSPHMYLPQTQCGFSRGGPERRSWRDLSPHRPPPVGDVVKGEVPIPEAVPLVDQPFMSSVRERAAAFDNAGGKASPKDPAEMSVQERLALFSRKQGAVLVPKAPFGQPVPLKTLHGDAAAGARENSSKPLVNHSQPVLKPAKRLASEPSPAITQKLHQIQSGTRLPSPGKDKLPSFESQRKVFENIKDNWRANEINSKIQTERQKEMDVLLNRFKKPRQNIATLNPDTASKDTGRPRFPVESESEYLESDDSYTESTASEDTITQGETAGPPKPPRLFLESTSSSFLSDVPPSSPPPLLPTTLQQSPRHKQQTYSHRLNSTKIGEVQTSPKKTFVTKVKPGHIYPSLTDIESHSEVPDSQDEDETRDSSFSESVLTFASIESLGQKIQHAASTAMDKPLSMIAENTEASNSDVYGMSESTMDALGAIDDAIDEALDEEPTPPKRIRSQDDSPLNAYKTPKLNQNSPTHQEDHETLTHSISLYRKQKPEVTYTPVRQIVRRPDLRSPTPEPVSPSVTVSARIKELQEEVSEQQRVIAQASNAVTVVLQRPEQQGTPQHVEAEKLLLLASQKRQTSLNEIQRLKTEGALGQQSWSGDEDTCMGSISISNISVPLKQDFLRKGMKGDDLYHLMVLVKHREQVISSQLQTTPECVVEGSVTFPNLMALHHLTSDFNITLEVYALCTHPQRQHNIKKEPSRMKLTPLKRMQKHDSRVCSPSVQSPGGPYAVRTSAFQLVGFTHLNISTLTRNAWTLEKVPFSSPLDGHLLMRVSCSFEGGIVERGFLTMFEDVGGYGAWNRLWCVLNGMHLRYWRYPDDEGKKEACGQIDLRTCTTRRIELVARDVCARQHTFQLTCVQPARAKDISNLVQEVHGSTLVTKYLLSSDSKEERIIWCNKLNKSLANIRAWDPDALRPEDYHV